MDLCGGNLPQNHEEVLMNNVLRIVTVLIGSFSASAQLNRGLLAKVPFHFVAGETSLPAGEYRVSEAGAPGVVSVRSLDGKTGAFVMSRRTESGNVRPKSSLVFNRYGNRYFLSEVRVAGERSGMLFPPTSAEVEAARRLGVTREAVITSASER
jgi:hypothetical protein